MPSRCLLYYITDRSAFQGDERVRRIRLLDKIAEAAATGVDYIQLREKDLSTRELAALAQDAIRIVAENCRPASSGQRPSTPLLINSRSDVAISVSAAGVHLRADDISPQHARTAWHRSSGAERLSKDPLIGVSCHKAVEVAQAAVDGASFAVFGPVFGKKDDASVLASGLDALREACRAKIPVLALGGITLENARSCLGAGAAGIAAIRLFQENDIATVVHAIRRCASDGDGKE